MQITVTVRCENSESPSNKLRVYFAEIYEKRVVKIPTKLFLAFKIALMRISVKFLTEKARVKIKLEIKHTINVIYFQV